MLAVACLLIEMRMPKPPSSTRFHAVQKVCRIPLEQRRLKISRIPSRPKLALGAGGRRAKTGVLKRELGCPSSTSKWRIVGQRLCCLGSPILPRWFPIQWFTDSLPADANSHFLQCRTRGANTFKHLQNQKSVGGTHFSGFLSSLNRILRRFWHNRRFSREGIERAPLPLRPDVGLVF